jgi:tetratricopeptide (TPR) repeat protein
MHRAAAASPVTTAIAAPPSSRRWWLIGGLAVAATAAVIAIVIGGHTREDASGSVLADRARHLDLDDVTAELDPGADIRWQRDRDGVHVEQRRGAATWRVAADEHLVIAAGATVASVEASGASLRVEVQMNQSDAKVIGTSAVTAAAVALVTVVVYDGHVKVGKDGGEPVAVAAGTTTEVKPAREPDRVADADCLPARDARRWADLMACARGLHDATRGKELVELAAGEQAAELKLIALRDAVAAHRIADAKRLAGEIPDSSVYLVEAQRMVAGACDGNAFRTQGAQAFTAGHFTDALAAFEGAWTCTHDPQVVRFAYLAACRAGDTAKTRFFLGIAPASQTSSMLALCRVDAKHDCDPDPHRQAGDAEYAAGKYTVALGEYEKALACKSDPSIVAKAAAVACRAQDAAKARLYADQLAAGSRRTIAEICTEAGVDLERLRTVDPAIEMLSPTCDANALRQDGQDAFTSGTYAVALVKFEAAYKCKPDPSLVRLIYMAACRSHAFGKAKQYFTMTPQPHQESLAKICLSEGFDPLRP